MVDSAGDQGQRRHRRWCRRILGRGRTLSRIGERQRHARFYQQPSVRQELAALRQAVTDGTMTPARAAARLLALAK